MAAKIRKYTLNVYVPFKYRGFCQNPKRDLMRFRSLSVVTYANDITETLYRERFVGNDDCKIPKTKMDYSKQFKCASNRCK